MSSDSDSSQARRPRYLQLELTTRCNFACGFCAGRHLPQIDMSEETFRSAIRLPEEPGFIQLEGEGESLLHPQFGAFVRILRETRPQTLLSMITNGSLLGDSMVKLLVADLSRIDISIETADEAEFRRIRGGSLAEVEAGIGRLQSARLEMPGSLRAVGLAITVLKQTVDQIDNITRLYDRHGLDGGIIFQPLQQMPAYRQFYQPQVKSYLPGSEDRRRVRGNIAANRRLLQILRSPQVEPGFYHRLQSRRAGSSGCPWLDRGLYVTANGTATTCCYIKDLENHGLGPATDNGWAGVVARRTEISNRLGGGDIPGQCQGCAFASPD